MRLSAKSSRSTNQNAPFGRLSTKSHEVAKWFGALCDSGPYVRVKDYPVEFIAGGATQNSIRVAQWQGLTFVHFSAQPEPFLPQKHPLTRPDTP